MKNLVRAAAIALALTGAVASANTNTASAKPVITKPAGVPIPSCPPNDPNACGMGAW